MPSIICPGCQRSVEPLDRIEKSKKTGKMYKISACPYERCKFNIDLSETTIKLWSEEKGYFQDYVNDD